MTSMKIFNKLFVGRMASEPVEDTDPSSFITDMSLKSNYPVQVTDPQDHVTLQLSSVPPRYLTTPKERIQQPVENEASEFICPGSITPGTYFTKDLQCLSNSCDKCTCSAPPPMISDLLDDEDLLSSLRLKLDTAYCTVKNWKNFASRWGMSYDELMLLEQRTRGSALHSPTQEFLFRYSQKSVTELAELCQQYQRIDVLRLLQQWVENVWPMRYRKSHS